MDYKSILTLLLKSLVESLAKNLIESGALTAAGGSTPTGVQMSTSHPKVKEAIEKTVEDLAK